MSHSHGHGHGHGHSHGSGHHHHHHHDSGEATSLPPALDLSVPDAELTPSQLSRRSMLRRTGLLGAGLAAGSVLAGAGQAAAAAPATSATSAAASGSRSDRSGGYLWLAGDHHIHTQYSSDGKFRVIDHVRHANAYGLDWMVITDHGSEAHAKIGVEKVNPDIVAARDQIEDTLVFQGLEWNIPAAEHGTVFVHPGRNEVAVLKEFENSFDGAVKKATAGTPANEALAIAGINFLAEQVQRRKVKDILFLANHPARKGIDSPHEIRSWRDAQPSIAVGMEGAPGHQAAGIKAPQGPGSGRGYYDNSPSADSFAAYPLESYRTWGGFDWMTATVGGLWDSLLAEGKPWWITANSDSHNVYTDTSVRGPNSDFNANGRYEDPVYGGAMDLANGDYWPGQYSRTHVGAASFSYKAVMDGIRAGRVWVDHGGLISGLDARLRSGKRAATLGEMLTVRRGSQVDLVVEISLAGGPNWSQFVPQLARVDVIQGTVTGAVSDKDAFTTPDTKVVKSFEVNKSTGTVRLTYSLGKVDKPFYVRLRGTDGNRSAVGIMGASVDPAGPAMDVVGDADPWKDLWFYSNPMWVLPA
ncbi:PHP domain-containing protein [Streptomyces sp. YIM S03343]